MGDGLLRGDPQLWNSLPREAHGSKFVIFPQKFSSTLFIPHVSSMFLSVWGFFLEFYGAILHHFKMHFVFTLLVVGKSPLA